MTPDAVGLRARAGYLDAIDALLVQHALALGCMTFIGSSWTSGSDPVEVPFDRIASASYNYNGAEEILARVDDGLAQVIVRERSVTLRAAGTDRLAAQAITDRVRELIPLDETRPGFAELTFWWWRPPPTHLTRQLPAPSPLEIERNYSHTTGAELRAVLGWDHPPGDGRLLLWHGEPGTGKTHAIRALASAWAEWATLHVVIDPEMFLKASSYMLEVVAENRGAGDRESRWRVVVLEDAGEYLAPDAKATNGQSLSRLLNLADGALGQALNTLLLITTNEPIRNLHPALSRPGRCLSEIAFGPLDRDEIAAWSDEHAIAPPGRNLATIAELYAHRDGRSPVNHGKTSVGFG